ncbi:hypothetical protein BDF22DRAFT_654480 [Syncephalis plumigaleata]|nr:hypothetical protein BDF22DRAFT_654480 [Syncephalis plumigaleata]
MDSPPNHAGLTTGESDWRMVPCGHIITQQEMIQIDANASMETACETLVTHCISSAPIYDEKEKHYIGMFDYSDLLTYVLLVLKRAKIPQHENTRQVLRLVREAAAEQNVPVRLASDLSQKNPFYALLAESSLIQALEIFAKGAHRLAIINQDGSIKGILSQSALIKYIAQQAGKYPSLDAILKQTLTELGVAQHKVISADASDQVLDALTVMNDHGVSSIAILDAQSHIIGNISVSDIKHLLSSDRHALLYTQCHAFASHIKMEDGLKNGMDSVPVFDVHADTTFKACLDKLIATKAHRVWVSDDQRRVTGVVSLTDISRMLAEHANL